MGVVISYEVTTALLPSLVKTWLRKGQMVIVNLAYVEYVDDKHDMLHVSRYDHTTIVPVLTDTNTNNSSHVLASGLSLPSTGINSKSTKSSHISAGGSGGSASTNIAGTATGRGRFVVPTGRASLGGMNTISSSSLSSSSSSSAMTSNRRMSLESTNSKEIGVSAIATATATATATASTATAAATDTLGRLIESERRRNEALRSCMEQYQPMLLSNISTNTSTTSSTELWESCARSRINGATVTLHLSAAASSDGDSHPSLSYSSTSSTSTTVSTSPVKDIAAGQGQTLRSSGRKSSSKRTNDGSNKDVTITTTTTTDAATDSEKRRRITEPEPVPVPLPDKNEDRGINEQVPSTVLLDVTYGSVTVTVEACSSKVPLVLLQKQRPSPSCLQSENTSPVTVVCDLVYAQIWERSGAQHSTSNGKDSGGSGRSVGGSDGGSEPPYRYNTTPSRLALNGDQDRWRVIWMRECT